MRFTTAAAIAFSAAASLVAADTCAAQNIVDACVSGYQSRIQGCASNDWICLCNVYTDVLVCYNNCPNSDEKPPVQNEVTSYCNAAAPLEASASASAASVASVAATQSQAASSTSAAASVTGTRTGAASSATASSFKTGAASSVGAPAGAALVALLGAAGLL